MALNIMIQVCLEVTVGSVGLLKIIKYQKNTKTWITSQRTIPLHKPVHLNFERRKTVVSRIDQQWQCDLCDIQNLHADNHGYKYLLVNIQDVFSKFAIVLTVEKQRCTNCEKRLYQINSTSKTKSCAN